jgi:hypothetical protein
MSKKEAEKKQGTGEQEGKEVSLLEELCPDDTRLYDFLSNYLLVDPVAGVSKQGLDVLTEEGEKSGHFRPAVDKAIFEAAQNPGEKERYVKIIQDLASKTIHATEQEKKEVEKQGLTDQAASLGRIIENQKFMSERAGDIIDAASKFYREKLVELGEDARREKRAAERREAEWKEQRIGEMEKAGRAARKKDERGMGRAEKMEAGKQDKAEEVAAEDRRQARAGQRTEAETEEKKIEQLEEAQREARKKERKGN